MTQETTANPDPNAKPDAGGDPKDDAQKPAKGPKLVKMVRDPEQYPEPHEALVHPDEVSNYAPGGWRTK